jgi:Asp-tRNA(Asn)/Glu-tRNA(Gln) amidotransferase C subunit
MTVPADKETIGAVARVAGIKIPEADLPSLAGAFANQLQAIAALEELDVDEVEPIVSFDPRWR